VQRDHDRPSRRRVAARQHDSLGLDAQVLHGGIVGNGLARRTLGPWTSKSAGLRLDRILFFADRRLVSEDAGPRLIEYLQARSLVIPTVFLTSIPLAFVEHGLRRVRWIWAYVLTVVLSRRYRDVRL